MLDTHVNLRDGTRDTAYRDSSPAPRPTLCCQGDEFGFDTGETDHVITILSFKFWLRYFFVLVQFPSAIITS